MRLKFRLRDLRPLRVETAGSIADRGRVDPEITKLPTFFQSLIPDFPFKTKSSIPDRSLFRFSFVLGRTDFDLFPIECSLTLFRIFHFSGTLPEPVKGEIYSQEKMGADLNYVEASELIFHE
ncbi:hypothetical protein NPIL_193811 [Nephila pilipes]|uniref:Uncharacterized protein n=1 Tax=Nephila pilipes TaxID=299642 RepID=A0A8X6SY28_NEPPI|nr:hypothetical protein NPIL_193811 [Nephila pilipes]